eukprot:297459_1
MPDEDTHRKTLSRFVSGGIAGVVANGILQPLDVVKTRLISADKSGLSASTTSLKRTVRVILSEDGVLGLWRGFVPTVTRVGLGSGVFFATLHMLAPDDRQHSVARSSMAGLGARFVAAT